jgi:hypothetical protein
MNFIRIFLHINIYYIVIPIKILTGKNFRLTLPNLYSDNQKFLLLFI